MDRIDEGVEAICCLLDETVVIEKLCCNFMYIGIKQLEETKKMSNFLTTFENSTAGEWINSLKSKFDQIFVKLESKFNSKDVRRAIEKMRGIEAVEEDYRTHPAEKPEEVVEFGYQFFKSIQDFLSTSIDDLAKGSNDFNLINQQISQAHEQLKDQNLEEIFGDSVSIFETSFATLQAHGEIIEAKSFAFKQFHENADKQLSLVLTMLEKAKEKVKDAKNGIESNLTKLTIPDAEKNQDKNLNQLEPSSTEGNSAEIEKVAEKEEGSK